MQTTEQHYVQPRDGNLYVGDTRVTVRSIITEWLQGVSPEEIMRDFPGLTLAQIYGTITYYLEHRPELDAYFREGDERAAQHRAQAEAADPAFYAAMRQRFAQAREARVESRPEAQALHEAGDTLAT